MRVLLILLFLCGLAAGAWAERVEGRVVDAAGAPVAGAQVLVGATEVTTGADGTFAVDDVGPRGADLLVVATGYALHVGKIRPGRAAEVVLVRDDVAGLEVIELAGEAPFVEGPAPYDLDGPTLGTIPGAGNDALKALQSLPGVARIPFGLGGLVLRGASPRSSNVFLDGIEVPILYHFGGLASFFPTGLIESLELQPGTFGARWGRAQGGIVDVRSRPARADRWQAGGEVSLLDAKAIGEGPVGGGGLAVGFRRSYVDAILAAAAPSLTLAPRYLDTQVRWDRGDPTERRGRLTAQLFASDDLLTFAREEDGMSDDALEYRSRFARAALTWRREEGPWTATVTPSVGADETSILVSDSKLIRRSFPIALRADVERTWTDASIAGGLDLVTARHSYDIDNEVPAGPGGGESDDPVRRAGALWAADVAGWIEGFYRIEGGRLGIRPGLRLDRFGLSDEWVLDPRIAITQELPRGVTVATAMGLYHQPPAPVDLDPAFGNQDLQSSSSVQASLGVTVPLPRASSIGVTAFWDRARGLPVDAVTSATAQVSGGPRGGGAAAASRELADEQFGSYSYRENRGLGRAMGVEVLVRKRAGAWTGWLAYTGSRAERRGDPRLDPRWYPYVLDQPHVLTALATVPVGAWQLGARVRVASGNPITPVAGTYFDTDRQSYRPIDGPILSQRLPAFVQLDVRVDRLWRRPWGSIKLFLDLQNATNRLNAEGVTYSHDYTRRSYTRGLPIFPSIGVEYLP